MIVVCPSCATRHDFPEAHIESDGAVICCSSCSHSWIESRAMEVIDVDEPAPDAVDAEREARRLTEAVKRAQERHRSSLRQRRQQMRGWVALTVALLVPVLVAVLLPHQVAQAFPPATRLYQLAGLDINRRGLQFRNVGQHQVVAGGVRVLALQGEIVNQGRREQSIPMLKFALYDEDGEQVYGWTLNPATRPIRPGEVSTFLTRLASPPATATRIEIRFAAEDETGSNARP